MHQGFTSACYDGNVQQVRLLLVDARVDPSYDDSVALRVAVGNCREEVVRVLLADPRVDPCACNNACLSWAARYNQVEIARMFLADPRVNEHAPKKGCIRGATKECALVFASNEHYGIGAHRELYVRYHPELVQQYDTMISQCLTMAWVASQLVSWSDIVLPWSDRVRAGFLSN